MGLGMVMGLGMEISISMNIFMKIMIGDGTMRLMCN
jgi:hypothetical protein